ncbi:hypothetical protein GCM10011390_07250 [Aureimonas endophytica]|uniref:Uncharacterized protein n=1 Tax=Aureimonas endophytica TaxID=2027858 RepID=A0A917E1R2_9HYPH|nr:hypothetical protein [Aureimonas endophytica]GGD91092.1 hypothetical protein GCM10011390_07250 [Aureimonas endophytica]
MDRDHRNDEAHENGSRREENDASSFRPLEQPSVEHAPREQVMKAARGVMARYHGVLRELAK